MKPIIESNNNSIIKQQDTTATMPKEQKKVKIGASSRHAPLGQVIQDDDNRGKYATSKRVIGSATGSKQKHNNNNTNDEYDEELLDERTSRKILELGREQQMEIMQEEEAAAARNILSSSNERYGEKKKKSGGGKKQRKVVKRRDDDSSDDSDNDDDEEDFDEEELLVEEDDKGYVTMSDTIGLTADEEALLSNMMGDNNDNEEMPERRNLADIIMAKIEEKEAGVMSNDNGGDYDNGEEGMMGVELPPKVVQVSTIVSPYRFM